jgi:hypothetical protein
MAKFLLLLLFLTLALVAASNGQHGGTDDEDDLEQRRETMAEIIRVFSNPMLTADADDETTRRLWGFMQRELGPLGPVLDAIVDMPEDSDDDLRSKVEALHAVQGLMYQHFRPLLKPQAKADLDGLLMRLAQVANKTVEGSLEDL